MGLNLNGAVRFIHPELLRAPDIPHRKCESGRGRQAEIPPIGIDKLIAVGHIGVNESVAAVRELFGPGEGIVPHMYFVAGKG